MGVAVVQNLEVYNDGDCTVDERALYPYVSNVTSGNLWRIAEGKEGNVEKYTRLNDSVQNPLDPELFCGEAIVIDSDLVVIRI